MLADFGMYLSNVLGGVENMYMFRVGGGYLGIAFLNPVEKFDILLFETVLARKRQIPLTGAPALQANLQWNSQKEYVLGLESSHRGFNDAFDGG